MDPEHNTSKTRLTAGLLVLLAGFLSPLLIPWVTNTSWPVGTKTVLSGLLAFGVPELLMVFAVSIMGKEVYEFIKQKVFAWIKPLLPPDRVSKGRYRFGLIMFCTPLLFGFLEPYLAHYFHFFTEIPIGWYVGLDLLFISSLFKSWS